MPVLKTGDLFSSWNEFEQRLKQYKEQNFVDFQIRDGRSIEGARKKCPGRVEKIELPDNLKYYQIRFQCVHGGIYKRKKDCKDLRKTSTLKQGCKAFIYVKVSADGKNLVISNMCEEHNHEVSRMLFKHLPSQRKLPPEIKKEVLELMALKVNKKLIQYKVQKDTGGIVTLRDLSNIASAGKCEKFKAKEKEKKELEQKELEQNDLEYVAKRLETKHNCTVHLCIDQDKNLMGVFIQDSSMKQSFQAFPELICVGSTYKLSDLQIPVFVLLVEDGNGHNEVVAVGLLIHEYEDTLNWFFETFKILNPAAEETKVIMTDKDLEKRSVIREVFPNACLRVGLYHSLKAFNQEVTCDKMEITLNERVACKKIFEQLCFAADIDEYDRFYRMLKKKAPKVVFDYFTENWDVIREEWSSAYTSFFGSFLNRTNNRLESFNAKMKTLISSFSSLEDFVTKLVIVVDSHRTERDTNTAKAIQRLPTDCITEDEMHYLTFLTPYAFTFIRQQMDLSAQENTENNPRESFIITENSCGCNFRYSMYLPCQHIFSYRKKMGFPLFDEDLCAERWSRNYYYKSQMVIEDVINMSSTDMDVTNMSSTDMDATNMSSAEMDATDMSSADMDATNMSSVEVGTINTVTSDVEPDQESETNPITVESFVESLPDYQVKKFEKASDMINKLANLLSESPDFEFEKRMKVLEDLYDKWSKRKEIKVIELTEDGWQAPSPKKPKLFCMPDVSSFRPILPRAYLAPTVPRTSAPVPGILHTVTGIAPTATGIAQTATGITPTVTGIAPTVTGITSTLAGIVPTVTGITSTLAGITPSATAITHSITGIAPTVLGITPTVLGLTPTVTGITPTVTGIAPTISGISPTLSGIAPGSKILLVFRQPGTNTVPVSGQQPAILLQTVPTETTNWTNTTLPSSCTNSVPEVLPKQECISPTPSTEETVSDDTSDCESPIRRVPFSSGTGLTPAPSVIYLNPSRNRRSSSPSAKESNVSSAVSESGHSAKRKEAPSVDPATEHTQDPFINLDLSSVVSLAQKGTNDCPNAAQSLFSAAKFSAPPERVASFLTAQEKLKKASNKFERMELMMSAFSDMLSFFS